MTMQFINPEEAGWGRLFYFPPWEVWLVTRPNRSHWARLCVRLKDPLASRRSWHLYWNDHEQRLAKGPPSHHLAKHHPDVVQQIMFRLRDWRP
jgi:hypothetical protein